MDQIVSLSRRRGFVFPSSEIYGGLGATYDYGHYGVLLKNNIRQRWFEAMVLERDDAWRNCSRHPLGQWPTWLTKPEKFSSFTPG